MARGGGGGGGGGGEWCILTFVLVCNELVTLCTSAFLPYTPYKYLFTLSLFLLLPLLLLGGVRKRHGRRRTISRTEDGTGGAGKKSEHEHGGDGGQSGPAFHVSQHSPLLLEELWCVFLHGRM